MDKNTDENNVTTERQEITWGNLLSSSKLCQELFPSTSPTQNDTRLKAIAFVHGKDKYITGDLISLAMRYRDLCNDRVENEGALLSLKHNIIRTMQLHGYKYPND